MNAKFATTFTEVYDTRSTIFSDQTGKFPYKSLSGNQYLMIMVDIYSSVILVEHIKTHSEASLTHAYSSFITHLHRVGIFPLKNVLDNEISMAMKSLITDTYKITQNCSTGLPSQNYSQSCNPK